MDQRKCAWLVAAAVFMTACSSSSNTNSREPGTGGDGDGDQPAGPNGGSGVIPGGGDGDGSSPAIPGAGDGDGDDPQEPPTLDPNATPFVRDDRPGTLDQGMIDRLEQGGACSAPPIYPYVGTVFPGALPAPTIMWNGNTEAVTVSFSYDNLDSVDYKLAGGPSNPGEISIPQEAWDEMTRRTQSTPLRVKIDALVDGSVSSCETVFQIAPGNMVGALYYNTYNAPNAASPGNGAVMRLTLGERSSEIYLQFQGPAVPVTGPCVSCHSVSSDGSTIVASTHLYGITPNFEVYSYGLAQSVQPPAIQAVPNANFGALTPDGTRMLAMGNPTCTTGANSFPRAPNNFPLVEGPDHARVVDTQTGAVMDATGLNPDWYMWMPQFSPNGDKVVFNHAKPDGNGGTDRRQLATMDYDAATNTFSNLKVIVDGLGPEPSLPYSPLVVGTPVPFGVEGCAVSYTDPVGGPVGALPAGTCSGPCYPAYPFFTPDGKGVVFALTNEPDFASAIPGRTRPAKGELWYVDLETGDVVELANINKSMNAADAQLEYYPTVLPVAVGGYFWVFWTSRRAYGHRNHHLEPLLSPEEDPYKKRIWAAALRPKVATAEVVMVDEDPSSPGFYVTGQSESGNVRAFAALNPCMATGNTCTAGLDCCTGFCYVEEGQEVGTCSEEIPECSKTNERCDSDDDCCPPEGPDVPQNICLGGFCNFVVVR